MLQNVFLLHILNGRVVKGLKDILEWFENETLMILSVILFSYAASETVCGFV